MPFLQDYVETGNAGSQRSLCRRPRGSLEILTVVCAVIAGTPNAHRTGKRIVFVACDLHTLQKDIRPFASKRCSHINASVCASVASEC